MFDYLQISNRRERYLVGTADLVLAAVAPMITRHSRRSSGGAERILVLRLERIGDFLMALPGIRAARRLAPHARIDLVVGSWSAALAGAITEVDRVEVLDVPWMAQERRGAGWSALLDRARAWRQRKYDVGINLEGDIRSNLLLGMSGAVRRAGFAMRGGGPLLTDPVEFAEAAHTATNIRRLVGHAFDADVDDNDAWENLAAGRWPVSDEASAQAGAVLAEHGAAGTLIGIQASAGREIKQWDPDRFAQVGTALARGGRHHDDRSRLPGCHRPRLAFSQRDHSCSLRSNLRAATCSEMRPRRKTTTPSTISRTDELVTLTTVRIVKMAYPMPRANERTLSGTNTRMGLKIVMTRSRIRKNLTPSRAKRIFERPTRESASAGSNATLYPARMNARVVVVGVEKPLGSMWMNSRR